MTERSDGRVQFDAIESHAALIEWSRRYCARAIAVHDLDVDLERVDWSVSTRARRRAAAVKSPSVDDAVVGEVREWSPAAWDAIPPSCELSLSWAAFDDFDRSEWRDTLRHELIHVEQFQQFGRTDHGAEFKARAEQLDVAVRCRRFADARYLLRCRDCDSVVARRYRASKMVKQPAEYRSNCCGAPLDCLEQ